MPVVAVRFAADGLSRARGQHTRGGVFLLLVVVRVLVLVFVVVLLGHGASRGGRTVAVPVVAVRLAADGVGGAGREGARAGGVGCWRGVSREVG